jgi:hypothetical protein
MKTREAEYVEGNNVPCSCNVSISLDPEQPGNISFEQNVFMEI